MPPEGYGTDGTGSAMVKTESHAMHTSVLEAPWWFWPWWMAYMLVNTSHSCAICYQPQTMSMKSYMNVTMPKNDKQALLESTIQFQLWTHDVRGTQSLVVAEMHWTLPNPSLCYQQQHLTYCIPTSSTTKLWVHRPTVWKGAAPIPPIPHPHSIFHTYTVGKITDGKHQSCCRR